MKSNQKNDIRFIVVEGVDGSGKSTQIKLLTQHLESQGNPYKYVHFPRTDSPVYGELIARFLRGDFGSINAVDPYLVALLYAGDRKDASQMIKGWLNEGYLVIMDRYVYSNIAFQCAKMPDRGKQEALRNWILNLEYTYNDIPKPDLNILLDVPFSFTRNKLSGNREGNERDYLMGQRDIHEDDLDFQKRVRDIYVWQAQTCSDLKIINCTDELGEMHAPEIIFKRVLNEIEHYGR
jgi:dTMP kinase